MRVGEPVALFTGAGGEYATTIAHIDRHDVILRVGRHDPVERESPRPVTLVQAVIAADMMDLTVRKAVELGVAAIFPMRSARSQNTPPERVPRRVAHWRQIAIAACEQCGRNRVPDVMPMTSFGEWIGTVHGTRDAVAILDADATRSLAGIVADVEPGTIAIGPEGGFTVEELRIAAEHGAMPVHLGDACCEPKPRRWPRSRRSTRSSATRGEMAEIGVGDVFPRNWAVGRRTCPEIHLRPRFPVSACRLIAGNQDAAAHTLDQHRVDGASPPAQRKLLAAPMADDDEVDAQ